MPIVDFTARMVGKLVGGTPAKHKLRG